MLKEELKQVEVMVEVKNLTKSYKDHTVLNQLSMTINKGEIHGILGRNGIGKTTLMESVVGLRPFNNGSIRVLGYDITKEREVIMSKVGIQPQEANLFPRLTIGETMQLFASFYGDSSAYYEIMDMLDLTTIKKKRVNSLSTGQKQRLLVALALIGNPGLVILDEPTTGIDPQIRRLIWDVLRNIRSENHSILLSTHSMEEAEKICDRISILHDQQIIATGTPEEIILTYRKTKAETLEDVFLSLTGTQLRKEVD